MRHFNISDGPDIFLIKDFSPKRWMMSDLTWGEMESQPAVSIISWLSVLYTLNGRKVTVWILIRYEKVNI